MSTRFDFGSHVLLVIIIIMKNLNRRSSRGHYAWLKSVANWRNSHIHVDRTSLIPFFTRTTSWKTMSLSGIQDIPVTDFLFGFVTV